MPIKTTSYDFEFKWQQKNFKSKKNWVSKMFPSTILDHFAKYFKVFMCQYIL